MSVRKPTMAQRLRQLVAVGAVGLVLGAALILFWPVDARGLPSHPNPVQSFAEAEQHVRALRAQEGDDFNPVCHTQFMSHGKKTGRVVVLIHGYSSCPQQFVELGRLFYQAGDNVLIVPMPWHGLADRMTEVHARLTAEQLTAYGDTVADIAQGLGDEVAVAGLSGGGVVTGWIAQNRPDVDRAMLIAPGFSFAQVPPALTLPASRLYGLLPNSFEWFDAERREAGAPPHSYPKYSTRALAQLMRLGLTVAAQARQAGPQAPVIVVVTNANDHSVSNPVTGEIVALWQGAGASEIRTLEFDAQLGLGHDLIDPAQPDQQIDLVYPKLLELARE